jgi:hypothetical protein
MMARSKQDFGVYYSITQEKVMKKSGLFSLIILGASLAAVGCSSAETAQAPQSAQTPETAANSGGAQPGSVSAVDTVDQSGAVTQADPAEQSAPVQAESVEEAPVVQ